MGPFVIVCHHGNNSDLTVSRGDAKTRNGTEPTRNIPQDAKTRNEHF